MFAGWDWQQDQFCKGEGRPIGWLPMEYTAPPAAAHGDEAVRKDAEAAYIEMTCQPVLIDGAHHYYLSSERMQAFDRLFSVDVSDAAIRAQVDGGIGDA